VEFRRFRGHLALSTEAGELHSADSPARQRRHISQVTSSVDASGEPLQSLLAETHDGFDHLDVRGLAPVMSVW
jgi:hypothetical protein